MAIEPIVPPVAEYVAVELESIELSSAEKVEMMNAEVG